MKNIKNYLPYIAGVLVFTIFGFSFLFTKNSLELMNPIQILAYRFAMAALLLTFLKSTGVLKINLKGKDIKGLLTLALTQPVAYFIFETNGINMTSSSEAGIMVSLIPIATTILAVLLLKENTNLKQVVFVFMSVAGAIFIILAKGTSGAGNNYLGLLVLMGAVVSSALYNILSRRVSLIFKPFEVTFVMMWTGAITFNLFGLLKAGLNGSAQSFYAPLLVKDSWVPVLYLGVISSVGAFFMMNYMLSKISASQTAVFSNLATVVSILAGVLIRGESFYWYQAVGGAMILMGVWGTNYYAGRDMVALARETKEYAAE